MLSIKGENDPRTVDHPTIINGEESITIKNPPSSSGGRGVGGHTSIGQMLMHRRRCPIPRSALLRFVFISFSHENGVGIANSYKLDKRTSKTMFASGLLDYFIPLS
jgi:hypothetical protein